MSRSLVRASVLLALLLPTFAPFAAAERLRVAGLAEDADGRPVAGAEVIVRGGAPAYATLATAKSGADGAFSADVEESAALLSVEVRKDGFAPSLLVNVKPVIVDVDLGVILLLRPGKLSGHVVDADGKAVAGATIYVQAPTDRETSARATSDAAGAFTIDGLPPAMIRIAALADGFAWSGRSLDLADRRAFDTTLRLAKGQELSGKTTPGAFVSFVPASGADAPPAVVADANGAFRLRGLPPDGSGAISVAAFGFVERDVPLAAARDGKPIVLDPAPVLRVTVNAAPGEPMPEIRSIRADVFTSAAAGSKQGFAKSGVDIAAGDARVEAKNVWQVSVPNGPQTRLGVELVGGATATMTDVKLLPRGAAAPIDVAIALPPHRSAAGRVVDPEGRPCEGADVVLSAPDRGAIQSLVAYRTRSAADGAFSFPSVDAGTWLLHAESTDLVSAAASVDLTRENVAGVELKLDAAASITGTVTWGGAPPTVPLVVAALNYRRDGLEGEWTTTATRRTGPDGKFRFSPLGTSLTLLAVRARPEADQGSLRDFAAEAPPVAQNGWPWIVIFEQPAQRQHMDIALDGDRMLFLAGRVDVNGLPRAGLRVSVRSLGGDDSRPARPAQRAPTFVGQRAVETDAEGRFRVRVQAPGTYEVEVVGGHLVARREIDVEPGEAETTIALSSGRVVGQIDVLHGTVDPDLRVVLEAPSTTGAGGEGSAAFETFAQEKVLADGTYSFDEVPAGRWRVTTLDVNAKRATMATPPFDLAEGQTASLAPLALPLAVPFEVTIKLGNTASTGKDAHLPYAALVVSGADPDRPIARDFQGWFVDGKAHVNGLPPAKVRVHVRAYGPWRAGEDQIVDLPADGSKVELQFVVEPVH